MNPSMPKPTLPELGPGDIEIIIEAPKEPDTLTKVIVNKTIRVEEQPSGTPTNHKVCCRCAAIGHVLESCLEDHGLKLTNCQMHHMGQTNSSANKMKPVGAGIDQLSDCFQNLTPKSPPASSTNLVPPPTTHKEIPASTTTNTGPGNIAKTGKNS